MANSAIRVLPAPVGADTITDSPRRIQRMACSWKGSSGKGYRWRKASRNCRSSSLRLPGIAASGLWRVTLVFFPSRLTCGSLGREVVASPELPGRLRVGKSPEAGLADLGLSFRHLQLHPHFRGGDGWSHPGEPLLHEGEVDVDVAEPHHRQRPAQWI